MSPDTSTNITSSSSNMSSITSTNIPSSSSSISSITNTSSGFEPQRDNAHNTPNQQDRDQGQGPDSHGQAPQRAEGSTRPAVPPPGSHAAETKLHVEVTSIRARYDCCGTRLSTLRGQWEDLSTRVRQAGRAPTGHQVMETTAALLTTNRQLVADLMALKGDAEALLAKLETGYGGAVDGRKPDWYEGAIVALRRAVNVRKLCVLLELMNLVTAGPLQRSVKRAYGLGE
ncbi:hypothetical protein PV04_04200 [Phialophora macrospora]|uniref:Uncharacterized protein n=1 Tax=Phialophora macrospora TaxID=1851006 RepID=A0A0D2FJF3_9EURO|nr:hypothetical protein PV04_04200 [Phialophora macrospora]